MLGTMRRTLGHKTDAWTDEKNSRLISRLDENGDGMIQEDEFVQGFCAKLPYDRPAFEQTIMAFLEVADAVNGEEDEPAMEEEDPLEKGFELYCQQFDSPLFDAAASPGANQPLAGSHLSVASDVQELSPAQRIRLDRSVRIEESLRSAAKEGVSRSRRGYTHQGAAVGSPALPRLSPNAARLARQERLRGVIQHPATNAKMGKDFEEYLREGQRLALSPGSATSVTSRLVSRLDTYFSMGASIAA